MSARRDEEDPGSGDLERTILGDSPSMTGPELAELSGVSREQARRLWRALGLPDYPDHVPAFTTPDAHAVATLKAVVETGVIDFDLAVNMVRALGQTMARLADWEISALVPRLEEMDHGRPAEPVVGADGDPEADDVDASDGLRHHAALSVIEEFGPVFEDLMLYVWRRHLAAAAGRIEALRAEDEAVHHAHLTVGFADIVGFTALSNTLSEDQIGDLVEIFEVRCTDVVAAERGRVIKSIGDSVLFVNDDPVGAYRIAEGIISVVGRDKRMPDVRLGLASGTVVMRLGDVFGPPVNMAARLTAVARRNRIIVDSHTAALLPPDQFETRTLPARPVRGFGVVEPLAVRRH